MKPADVNELRGVRNMSDVGRVVFDAMQIMFCRPMNKPEPANLNIRKQTIQHFKSSFESHSVKLLTENKLISMMTDFDKCSVNEETLELLEPYFDLTTNDGKE